MSALKQVLKNILNWFRSGYVRWLILGLIVGAISGLGAAGFFYILEYAKHFTFDYLAGYEMTSPAGERLFETEFDTSFKSWLFFLFPAIGGLVSGLIVFTFAPEAEGHGTDAMIDSFHRKAGKIRARVPFVKSVATIATLASGGSAGREGPIAQIGAGIGSWLGRALKLPARDRRIMLLAGTGGGLGAIFRAPLGGAITACEVIYKEDLETDALIPTVISSITAYTIFSEIFGFHPIFQVPELKFHSPNQLIFYMVLGLVCLPVGLLYIRTFYFIRNDLFGRMRIPPHVKPMIGGLGVGIIGFWVPQIYSGGWGQLQLALLGKMTLETMALAMVFKILATSFTIGSGGSGGVFGPTLFIGGMIGGVVGHVSHLYFPEIVTQPDISAFVLVGMASFFAGVAHAPLGALLMVTEMTAGYHLIAPLLLVSAVAIMFNRRYSIYKAQVKNKFHSPAHIGEFTVNVLEDMYVKSVYRPKKKVFTIPANAGLNQVQDFLAMEEEEIFPVVKQDGTILGLLSLDTSRPILFEEGVDQFLIAEDLAIPAGHVHPDDSLYQALVEFLKYPISGILVTDPDNDNKVLGVLHHRDLIRAYNNEIIKRKQP